MFTRSAAPAAYAAAAATLAALLAPAPARAQDDEIPGWLASHVGTGEGQIAEPVLERARALYRRKVAEGAVSNPCWFAMDATRPNDPDGGRFYTVCEAARTFEAIPAGHGSGRKLGTLADFSNGRRCARNFGNAADSDLTTGGIYVTGEARSSFKGYYRASPTQDAAFVRTFVPFVGEGDTANARSREIGGHAAVTLKGVCLRQDPASPYANPQGYVPFGHLVSYPGGRSNGCTSWSADDADRIGALVAHDPTTLYIYPEASDIRAAARALAAGRTPDSQGVYWSAACAGEIGTPKFWTRQALEPLIARFKAEHPAPPPRPTPICAGG